MVDKGGSQKQSSGSDPADELLLDQPLRVARHTEPRTPEGYEPLITALGGGALDFPAMLAIADILPVMTAYVDREFRYFFVNKPLAKWLDMPRKEILGKTMRDVLGDKAFEQRLPMLETALTGERTFFASEFEHV